MKLAMGGISVGPRIWTVTVAECAMLPLFAETITSQLADPPGGGVVEAVIIRLALNIPDGVSVKVAGEMVAVG